MPSKSTDVDASMLRRWAELAVAGLQRQCAEIDRINVFPVPDSDTGTNMLLTMRAAVEHVQERFGAPAAAAAAADTGCRARPGTPGTPGTDGLPEAAAVAAALARGALLGARGNSGVILSQVLRGLAEAFAERGPEPWAAGLRRAHELAMAAVSIPEEGTVLTVLAAAAAAASEPSCHTDPIALGATPVLAAVVAAREALARTPEQLPVLAEAGVVDAGGFGFTVVLEALAEALLGGQSVPPYTSAAAGELSRSRLRRARAELLTARESGSVEHDYEVMYLLDASDEHQVATLRKTLDRIGDSVVLVSDGGADGQQTWKVHVHCSDVGAVIEAGIEAGRPHQITVLRFDPAAPVGPRTFMRERAVLLVVEGTGAAQLARGSGAQVLQTNGRPPGADELLTALLATGAQHAALLACDRGLADVAGSAAARARERGQQVVVVPAGSTPQGLAALAVHDPGRAAADDVVAMAEAAAATRTGVLRIADEEALTWVGRCAPGEVLGFSDGEVVLIAPDLSVGALWLAHRMLTPGGEMVTALLGADVPDELGERLVEDLRRSRPEVDVVVYRGEQAAPLVLGVE